MSDNIKNDLLLKELDQLHSATLQFSNSSMELKKICISLMIGIPTILIQINGKKFDILIPMILVPALLIFWFLDAQNYYYPTFRWKQKIMTEGHWTKLQV